MRLTLHFQEEAGATRGNQHCDLRNIFKCLCSQGENWRDLEFNPVIKISHVHIKTQQPSQGGVSSSLFPLEEACHMTEVSTPSSLASRPCILPRSGMDCQITRLCSFSVQVPGILRNLSAVLLGALTGNQGCIWVGSRREGPLWLAFPLLAGSLQTINPSTCQHSVFGPRVSLGDLYLHWPADNSFLSEEEAGGGKEHTCSLSINCEDLSIGCVARSGNLSSAALCGGDRDCIISHPGQAPLQGHLQVQRF